MHFITCCVSKKRLYIKHFFMRREQLVLMLCFISRSSSLMSSEWESLYGEVVWAKCPPFNWWPCYVYDPDKIPDTSGEVRKKAAKLNGKQYAVYFYGDTSYSFTVPKNIVPYNEESKAKFAKIPPKRYAAQFASGIEIADIEVALEKHNRVNFHLQGSGANKGSDNTEAKKRGRPKKTDTSIRNDELYFVEPGQKKGMKRGGDDNDVNEMQSDAEDDNAGKPAKVGKKKKEVTAKRGRGRPRLHPRPEQEQGEEEELSDSNNSGEADDDNDEEGEEDGSVASDDDDDEEEVIVRPSVKRRKTVDENRSGFIDASSSSASRVSARSGSLAAAGAATAAKVGSAGSSSGSGAFADESPVDRLVRFGKILAVCTAAPAEAEREGESSGAKNHRDCARAVKLLDKLFSVEVSSAELVKSGIGKIITELRKSQDADISSRAQALRAKWKAIVQNEGPSPRSGASATSTAVSVTNNTNGSAGGCLFRETAANALHGTGLHGELGTMTTTAAGAAAGEATAPLQLPSLTLTPAQSQARARAVRLLREAASSASSSFTTAPSAAPSIAVGCSVDNENSSNINMNSGELAFAAEKLAMEALGGPAQPRYLEFVTRLAAKLKNGSVSISSSDALQSHLNDFQFVSVHGL